MYRYTQYGEYAVSNNIILVFPQVSDDAVCHDTYFYTGDNYASKDGVQPQFYAGVIERLTSERDPSFDYENYFFAAIFDRISVIFPVIFNFLKTKFFSGGSEA